MKKLIFGGAILAFAGLTLIACKKDHISPNGADSSATNGQIQTKSIISDEATILGDKLPNPFTVDNMKEAYTNLDPSSTVTIEKNQLYVRFMVSDAQKMMDLEEHNLTLSTEPLDYEIIQYGSYYNDPSLNDKTWIYTTVPINFNFDGFDYEILDELFLPDLLVGTPEYGNFFVDFDHEDLIDEALRIKGYEDETMEKAVKYRPKGYIKVQQNIGGITTPVPVKRIKVRSRWWFNWGTGYTDDNGYFECSALYRKNRKVKIICIFENQYVNLRAVKGTQFWDIFFTERKQIGQYQNSALESINYLFVNSTDITTDTKRKWMACHALNAIREQHVYCGPNGVQAPPNNLNLWLTNANANGNSLSTYAAAPMLKQMANTSAVVNAVQLFLVATGHPWWAVAIQVLSQFPPDITYNYSQNSGYYTNSDQIAQIFYHEYAHASHYAKVGNPYWTSYISYILQNGGYGNSTDVGAGRIAISEAWAEFCSSRFAHSRYGNGNSLGQPVPGNWQNKIENFIPYAFTTSWNWIPDGVMHDLTDSGEPSFTSVNDNVSGYSISQCFGSMDYDVVTVLGYRNRFKLEYGSSQSIQIDGLFKSYGYN